MNRFRVLRLLNCALVLDGGKLNGKQYLSPTAFT